MKKNLLITCVGITTFAVSVLVIGCDRQVSSETKTSVSSDGTVKTKEKTVTQAPDGTVTKTEADKKTTPPPQP